MDFLDLNITQDPLALVQLEWNQLPHYLGLKQTRKLESLYGWIHGHSCQPVVVWQI